jgi:hypothetical protein
LSNSINKSEYIIHKFKEIHGSKYDYSLVNYTKKGNNVIIICQNHGKFEQSTANHKSKRGCPICSESIGESEIRNLLTNNKIKFVKWKRFSDCKDKKPLPFDFYLLDYNTCIEFNGEQHYRPIEWFGGIDGFKKQEKRDKIKMEYCKNNNIPLIIIKYDENILKKLIEFKIIP